MSGAGMKVGSLVYQMEKKKMSERISLSLSQCLMTAQEKGIEKDRELEITL